MTPTVKRLKELFYPDSKMEDTFLDLNVFTSFFRGADKQDAITDALRWHDENDPDADPVRAVIACSWQEENNPKNAAHLCHQGDTAFACELLREIGFTVNWDGDNGKCIEVIYTGEENDQQ